MAGWHHRCNEHELGQTPGDGGGQGGLVCCSQWGHKESNMTGRLNNNRIRNVILNNKLFFILLLYIVSKTSLGIPCHVEI